MLINQRKIIMKNVILGASIIGLTCLSATAFSRDLAQGTIEIGGDLDLSLDSSELDITGSDTMDTDTTTLNATGLYYVAPNIGVGLIWNYDSTEVSGAGDKLEESSNLIGPAASYNLSLNDKTSLQFQGALALASIEVKDSFSGTTTIDGFGWVVGAQLSYFLTDAVSIDGSLVYTSLSLEEDETKTDVDSTGFGTGVGLTVYLN